MRPASTPRHRADVAGRHKPVHLRRTLARLLAGTDVYADDVLLRPPTTPGPRATSPLESLRPADEAPPVSAARWSTSASVPTR